MTLTIALLVILTLWAAIGAGCLVFAYDGAEPQAWPSLIETLFVVGVGPIFLAFALIDDFPGTCEDIWRWMNGE